MEAQRGCVTWVVNAVPGLEHGAFTPNLHPKGSLAMLWNLTAGNMLLVRCGGRSVLCGGRD